MPPIRAPGMVKGVASVRSGAQTAAPKAGKRKLAHFNHLEEGGNRLDGKEVSKNRLAYLSSKRAGLQKKGLDLNEKEREELGTFRKQAGCDSASEIRARAALKRENEQRIAKGLKPLPVDDHLSPHPSDSEMDELDEAEEDDDDEAQDQESDAPVKASAARPPVNPIKKQQQLERARLKRQAARRAAGKKERKTNSKSKGKGKGKRMRAEVSDDSDVAEEKEREREERKKKKAGASKKASSSSSSKNKSSSLKSNSRYVLDAMDSDAIDDVSEEEERRPRPKKKTRTLVRKKDVPKSGWRSIYDDEEEEEPLFAQPSDEDMEVEVDDDNENPTWAHEGEEESDATRRRRAKGKGRAERESDVEFDEIVETEEEEEEEETDLFNQLVAPVRARLGIDPSYSSSKKVAPANASSTFQPQKKPVVDSDEDEDDGTQQLDSHSPSRSNSQDVIELSDTEDEDSDADLPTVDKAISKIPRAKPNATKSQPKPKLKQKTSSTSASTSKKSKPTPTASSSRPTASSSKSKTKPPTPLSPSKISTSYASITYDRDPTSKRAPKPSVVDDNENDPFPLRLGKAIKTPKAPLARPSAEGPHKLEGGGRVKVGKPAGESTLEMEARIRQKKLLEGRPSVVLRGGGGAGGGLDVAAGSASIRQPSNTNAVAGSSRQQQPQAGPSRPRSSLPTSGTSPSTSSSSNSSSNGPKNSHLSS